MDTARRPFHIVAKPMGPLCNMKCSYCFYSEKLAMYPQACAMTDGTLERFVRAYLRASPGPEVNFLWQGGEPLLAGIPFYRKALAFQRKYRGTKRVSNAIQTNGTLLTDEWCRFLRANGFLVGISLDGPPEIHDAYRAMRSGKPSYPAVVRGVELMQRHGVDYNVTCCVSDLSAREPLAVYRHLKSLGARYLQFAPLVERAPGAEEREAGLLHASPDAVLPQPEMAECSVSAAGYGAFLNAVFDEWVRQDVGEVYVMNFEWALAAWMGLPASYCIFAPACGDALAVEHNGDLYSCDHYVYPEYQIGSLNGGALPELLDSPAQRRFRRKKSDLPQKCLSCGYRFACHGECPKNRFLPGGENYLCEGYRSYFAHIAPYMKRMAQLLRAGKDPALIRNGLDG